MIIESIRYRFHQSIPGMQVSINLYLCTFPEKSMYCIYTLTNCHLFKSMLPSNATYFSAEAVAWSASGNHQVPYSPFLQSSSNVLHDGSLPHHGDTTSDHRPHFRAKKSAPSTVRMEPSSLFFVSVSPPKAIPSISVTGG